MRNRRGLLAAFVLTNLSLISSLATAQGKTPPASLDWRTPTEICEYRCTPRYDEAMAYIRRVVAAAPKQVKIEPWGKTGEGRELVGVIVSKDGVFDPAEIHKADRPVVYIQNGIHAGEIEGKDASLALLRDMVVTKTQAKLLDKSVVIIVPVYNIDGHERVSRYNRINQNGPEEMGWRTQSNNLNLNRDYMKADSVEARQFLAYFAKWLPDFFIDDHGSFVIFRSASVRPRHLFDQNFDHDYFFKLPLQGAGCPIKWTVFYFPPCPVPSCPAYEPHLPDCEYSQPFRHIQYN